MRTVIISCVSVCCILLLVMIQSTVNSQSVREAELRDGLGTAVSQTMREVMESDGKGIEDREDLVAAFMQSLLAKVSSDIELTVKIYSVDIENGLMDVEVCGEYQTAAGKTKTLKVRRTVIYDEKRNPSKDGKVS